MRSIHNHKPTSNNKSSGAILFKHRTKPKNSSGRFIILSIIPLLPLFLLSILLNLSAPLGGDAYATTTTLTVDNSDTVLELTLPSSLTLDLIPSSANNHVAFGTKRLKIGAGTNNSAGYTLSMTADSSFLTRTANVIDGNSNTITPTIDPLSTTGNINGYNASDYESSIYDTYTMNTWGYKLSTTTNYMPMSTNSIELANTIAPSNASSISGNNNGDVAIDFAAKVDSSKPAGTYRTTISFAMVANVSLNCDVDLTGCTYYFNETPDIAAYGMGGASYNINFISNNNTFNSLELNPEMAMPIMYFLKYRPSSLPPVNACEYEEGSAATWTDQLYRTITITGGADATNQNLITWLQANATQL